MWYKQPAAQVARSTAHPSPTPYPSHNPPCRGRMKPTLRAHREDQRQAGTNSLLSPPPPRSIPGALCRGHHRPRGVTGTTPAPLHHQPGGGWLLGPGHAGWAGARRAGPARPQCEQLTSNHPRGTVNSFVLQKKENKKKLV